MSHRREREAAEQPLAGEGEDHHPRRGEVRSVEPPEVATLRVGSRSPLVEKRHEPAPLGWPQGLLRVPPEVEAEVRRQEANQPMTPAYRKMLCDRLRWNTTLRTSKSLSAGCRRNRGPGRRTRADRPNFAGPAPQRARGRHLWSGLIVSQLEVPLLGKTLLATGDVLLRANCGRPASRPSLPACDP